MRTFRKAFLWFVAATACILFNNRAAAQDTQIRGFIETYATYQDEKVSFGFGEQDLFITSELTDRISFLGESVFKFGTSPTSFNVSIERVIVKYNFKGNHSLLIGKHHTPVNYWNDTYHHGRVFFPTIGRPLLFDAQVIPLHTTGVGLQGMNLGNLRLGYDLMVGNGLGSNDITDNDKHKSLTLAAHIKPSEGLRIGGSFYWDILSRGAFHHGDTVPDKINQRLISGTVAYFGERFEALAETTFASNDPENFSRTNTWAAYLYAGFRLADKWIPYFRVDWLDFEEGEIFYHNTDTKAFIAGLRYEINYLAVVKMEFEHDDRELSGKTNKLTMQVAVGF